MIRHDSTGRGQHARIGIGHGLEDSGLELCLLTIHLEVNNVSTFRPPMIMLQMRKVD